MEQVSHSFSSARFSWPLAPYLHSDFTTCGTASPTKEMICRWIRRGWSSLWWRGVRGRRSAPTTGNSISAASASTRRQRPHLRRRRRHHQPEQRGNERGRIQSSISTISGEELKQKISCSKREAAARHTEEDARARQAHTENRGGRREGLRWLSRVSLSVCNERQ